MARHPGDRSYSRPGGGGVYEGADGETVDESSPALDPVANPRQGRMVYAEREVVSLGGVRWEVADPRL